MGRVLFVVAIGVIAASAGCRDAAAPVTNLHVGTYTLREINGHAPPQIVSDDADGTISIVAGSVILNADNSFVDSTELQIVNAGGIGTFHDVGRGSYRFSNDTVFFRTQSSEYVMVRDGAELVQDFDGIELVYRR